jgi:cytochrome c-type biogenesis protein CcmH
MTNDHLFWFAAGAMTAIAAMLLSMPLFKHLNGRYGATRARVFAIGAVMLVIGAALGLYRMWGSPGAISLSSTETALVSTMAHPELEPGAGAASGSAKIGSVEEATAKLAARLSAKGGTPAEWNLLAQSYDFMGRPADAAEARRRAGSATGPTVAPAVSAEGTAALAQAEKFRIAHDYAKALERYKQAAQLNALDAGAWANYADVAASASGGNLDGPPGEYVARALQLDPDHPKALWLQASLLHEQRRYAEAVEVWRHLAKVLPPNSPDGRIIAANVAEILRLAGGAAAAPAVADAGAPPGTVQISGTIDIDPKLRAKASSGLTLFVFAKSVDSPGPPLAVVRTTVGQWPVKFQLNDSQAMMPQRKLSDFHAVRVEARISANGQPLAQPGDMQGSSGTLDPKSDKPVHLVIREVIG